MKESNGDFIMLIMKQKLTTDRFQKFLTRRRKGVLKMFKETCNKMFIPVHISDYNVTHNVTIQQGKLIVTAEYNFVTFIHIPVKQFVHTLLKEFNGMLTNYFSIVTKYNRFVNTINFEVKDVKVYVKDSDRLVMLPKVVRVIGGIKIEVKLRFKVIVTYVLKKSVS